MSRFGFVTLLWLAFPVGLFGAPTPTNQLRFEFREPHRAVYRVGASLAQTSTALAAMTPQLPGQQWVQAWREDGSLYPVQFGTRVVLQLENPAALRSSIKGRPLKLVRKLPGNHFILDCPDAVTAMTEAARLAQTKGVLASYPVARRQFKLHNLYARRPNDPYFFVPDAPNTMWQAYLENRDAAGNPIGVDLNVRAAWPVSQGAGVIIAIADDGLELGHPDLAPQVAGAPHFNFYSKTTNGSPAGSMSSHATAVAGLAAAAGNNRIGISGVAPAARLASWVLFTADDTLDLSEEELMDAFQYQSNVVSIQNHSWGKVGDQQLRLSSVENIGISNAVTFGRGGRGVILVRSGGNDRVNGFNSNDDGYTADPRIISVAAVRLDGKFARYSTPGASLLVSAPSGDSTPDFDPCITNTANLFTTDRQGLLGYNRNTYTNDLADYTFGDSGFSGTSASAPEISGIAALILSANTNLSFRDVQQILALSSRFYDLSDPDLTTNGAGFRVSHNLGFGVPDAGMAVRLARSWSRRPAATKLTYSSTNVAAISNTGLRLIMEGPDLPASLASIATLPSTGIHPDDRTATLPLVDIGLAKDTASTDLHGRAALIQRGDNYFCEKVANAAAAGAAFAVVYNNRDATVRVQMAELDYAPIPAVGISQNDGEALRDYLQNHPRARAHLEFFPTTYSFQVSETLLCEHVGVYIDTDYTRRGDIRLTLQSPQGTRSILQRMNADPTPGPSDWTYFSTHHFFESSAGLWTVSISAEDTQGTGSVHSIRLIFYGTPIVDTDHDGLDDRWELRYFKTLAFGPKDDPDQDGYSNAMEQLMGTNPAQVDLPFHVDAATWNGEIARLSWPGSTNYTYAIRTASDPVAPLALITNISGKFPQTEWFTPHTNLTQQFFRIQAIPNSRK